MQSWDDLAPPWREALRLAWEAYSVPTIPVGAVITDADGTVLSRGRNRIFDSAAPPGQIFGSRVAHAEINALVQLSLDRRYEDCTLWTTLEPCSQCIGAAWLSTIGTVRFAAPDIYAGASKMIERHIEAADSFKRTPMAVDGPIEGPAAVFAELLHAEIFLRNRPESEVALAYRDRRPELVALAAQLDLHAHVGTPLEDVLARIWDDLL